MDIGVRLAKYLKAGDLVALVGIFGAGKTYFTKGIARGLGVKRPQEVISPSFTLCHVHQGKKSTLYHLDVQRLKNPEDFVDLGIQDFFGHGVVVIEWADKFRQLFEPLHIMKVVFKVQGRNKRELSFSGRGKRFIGLGKKLKIKR